ncbi:MAG: hypothetical protein IPJ88_13320 [Myxococcales bacterium]|nr:MAG: hypothetical protein IPJ88_13320 [Myxococcales bacterium]
MTQTIDTTVGTLLDLAARKATGSIVVGGRRIVLRQGEVSNVEGSSNDIDFERFLFETSRLSPQRIERIREQAKQYALSFAEAISQHHDLESTIKDTWRALWLHRLRLGLSEADDESSFTPYAPPSPTECKTKLIYLLLDALKNDAQDELADEIGRSANSLWKWTDNPLTEQARKWATLEEPDPASTVMDALQRNPAATPRFAALLKAKLIEISYTKRSNPSNASKKSDPRARTRTHTYQPASKLSEGITQEIDLLTFDPRITPKEDAPEQTKATSSEKGEETQPFSLGEQRVPPPLPKEPNLASSRAEEPRKDTLRPFGAAPRKGPVRQAPPSPGEGAQTSIYLREFPEPSIRLDDPLEEIESKLSGKSTSRLQAHEISELWQRIGHIWIHTLKSPTEALRAYREAVAADPSNIEASESAINIAQSLAERELSLAYAKAAVGHAKAEQRVAALHLLSFAALRVSNSELALEALRELAQSCPSDPEIYELQARALALSGTVDDVESFSLATCKAAVLWASSHSERALALLCWGLQVCPTSERILQSYVALLNSLDKKDAAEIISQWFWLQHTPDDKNSSVSRLSIVIAEIFSGKDIRSSDDHKQLERFLEVRHVFGDAPPILAAIAEVANRVSDHAVMREVADTWFHITPLDPGAALVRLLARCETRNTGPICQAAFDVLDSVFLHPATLDALRLTLQRLLRIGSVGAALRVAEQAFHVVGHLFNTDDKGLGNTLEDLRRAPGADDFSLTTLEHGLNDMQGEDRAEALLRIADFHRQKKRFVGEMRALLRVLALEPTNKIAFNRLEELLVNSGRYSRLKALYALRMNHASRPEEKWECLLDLIAIAYRVEHDTQEAEQFLSEIIADRERFPAALFIAAGTLVTMKRANDAIKLLLDAGKDDRDLFIRCSLQAAKIAEEDLQDGAQALRFVADALLDSGQSVLLPTFERLALKTDAVAQAQKVFDAFARQALGRHGRRAIYYRAGRWFELAGALALALNAYRTAFEEKPAPGIIFFSLCRTAESTGNFELSVKSNITLAESPLPDAERAQCYRHAAQLSFDHLNSPQTATEFAAKAWELERSDTCKATMMRYAKACLSPDGRPPEWLEALMNSLQLDLPLPKKDRPDTKASSQPASENLSSDALELLQTSPWQTSALPALLQQTNRPHFRFYASMAEHMRSFYSNETQAPSAISSEWLSKDFDSFELLTSAEFQRHAPIFERLWLAANPVFRKPLALYQLKESDRLSPLDAPITLGRAYMTGNRVLRTEQPALYRKHPGADELKVIATAKPAIMFGPHLDLSEQRLVFRMAYNLQLTSPALVLFATLDSHEGDALIEALHAAFGDTRTRAPSKNAAKLGAELWETMPKKDQDWMRKTMAQTPELPNFSSFRQAAFDSALRAGLLVSGSLRVAIEALASFDSSFSPLSLATEEGFQSICKQNSSMQTLIRFAFSPELAELFTIP